MKLPTTTSAMSQMLNTRQIVPGYYKSMRVLITQYLVLQTTYLSLYRMETLLITAGYVS
jgi:hypothetical protein